MTLHKVCLSTLAPLDFVWRHKALDVLITTFCCVFQSACLSCHLTTPLRSEALDLECFCEFFWVGSLISLKLQNFQTCSDAFGGVQMDSDTFECMHLHAFWCVRTFSHNRWVVVLVCLAQHCSQNSGWHWAPGQMYWKYRDVNKLAMWHRVTPNTPTQPLSITAKTSELIICKIVNSVQYQPSKSYQQKRTWCKLMLDNCIKCSSQTEHSSTPFVSLVWMHY